MIAIQDHGTNESSLETLPLFGAIKRRKFLKICCNLIDTNRKYSCSPATVSKVRRRLEAVDITSVSQIANMSDQELAELYYGAGRAVSTHADITVIRSNRRLEKQSAKPVLRPVL